MAAADDGVVDARGRMIDVQIAGRGVRDERVLEANRALRNALTRTALFPSAPARRFPSLISWP
jgi:hypothetical protein